MGWLSAGTAGKAQTWELLSQMKRTQQGFKALFLGFLCIGKFLRVSRSNNSSRLCPQRKSIVGAHGRHAQSSSAMKSAGIKGKKKSAFSALISLNRPKNKGGGCRWGLSPDGCVWSIPWRACSPIPHAQACRDSGHSLIASAPQLQSEATAVGKYFKYI